MAIDLNPISSGYSTGLINDNFQAVEDYINNNLLNRDGLASGVPNQMELSLDMNSNFIYNLPEPTLDHQAARLQDVQNAVAGGAANLITFTPYNYITADNVQLAVQQVLDTTQTEIQALEDQIGTTDGGVVTAVGSMSELEALDTTGFATGKLFNVVGTIVQWDGSALVPHSPVFARSFGAIPGTGANVTTAVNEALDYHSTHRVRLLFEPGEYIYDGITRIDSTFYVDIACENGKAVFKGTSALSADGRMFRFESDPANFVSLTLSVDVEPGRDYFVLSDVSNVSAGDVIQISSNELWPYDNRGVYYKGELHLIREVDVSASRVYFYDLTRDSYATANVQQLQSWTPRRFRVENIVSDMSEQGGTSCFQISHCIEPEFIGVRAEGAVSWGGLIYSSWKPRIFDFTAYHIGDGLGNGYGFQDRSCTGTLVDGLYTTGCRRAFDASSLSGANSAPSRDYRVTNFVVNGGGAYWPFTSEGNYGVGNHGSSENGEFSNGTILHCQTGINLRGSKQSLSNINIYGKCKNPVDLTFGTGADITNVNYSPDQYPNKGLGLSEISSGQLPDALVFIGRASTEDANWDFSLPVRITGCAATGLVLSAIYSASSSDIYNVNMSGCTLLAKASSSDFYTVRMGGTGNLSRSVFNGNLIDTGSRSNAFCNLDYAENDGLGGSWAVTINDVLVMRIGDNQAARVGQFGLYSGARPIIHFSGDAGGRGMYEIRALDATATQAGNISFTNLVATASPESLNGTFGTDGNFTVGLNEEGILFAENRLGATRTFRFSLVC